MKTSWKTMKRCIALVLAMAILLSTSNFGFAPHVHAVEDEPGKKLSAIIAENYDLPEALEEIIQSGKLKAEKTITYEQPEEDVIEVNSDEKTITAYTTNGWRPASAKIVVGEETVETVTLNEGTGTYAYAGNAFSVVVTYELYVEVTADEQLALINAAYYLAEDIKTVGCLRDGAVELVLSTLTSEMEQLKDVEGITLNGNTPIDLIHQLATDGIELPALTLGGRTTVLKFDDIADSIDDAEKLLIDKNDDGMLVLHNVLKGLASASSLELLDKNSAKLDDALKSNYDSIYALAYDDYGLAYVLKKLQKYNSDAIMAIDKAKEDLAAAGTELAEAEALIAQLREAEAFLAQAKSLLAEYHAAKEQIAAAREALAEYNAAIAKLDEGIKGLNDYYDAKEQLDDGKADYEAAKELLKKYPNLTSVREVVEKYEAAAAALEQAKAEAQAKLAEISAATGVSITLSFENREADVKVLTDAKATLKDEANAKLAPYGATVDNAAAKLDAAEAELTAQVQKVIDDYGLAAEGVTVDNIGTYIAEQETKLNAAKAEADAMLKEKFGDEASIDNAEKYIEDAKKEMAAAEDYVTNAETVLLPQLAEVADAMELLITTLKQFCSKAAPAYNCDSWNVVDKDILLDNLSKADYTKLNGQVEALEETKLYTEEDVKISLLVDTKEIQYNMSMFDVSIEVIVYKLDGTVGSNNLVEAQKLTGKVTLEEGATHAAIKSAIEAANVVPTVDLTYYQIPEVTALPDSLTEDITYTAKYYPNTYTYKIMDGANELTSDTVYYGFQLRLPAYTGAEDQVYEYKVGNKVHAQKEIVKITDNVTFERVQGKPRTGIAIKDILAGNIAGGLTSNALVYGLSSEAAAILSSAAVLSDKINLRVPAAADVTVEFVGDKITATGYASDFGGLYWKPVAVNFVADNGTVVDTVAMIDGEATITDKNYARANIKYELVIDSISGDALEMLNLPDELVQDYAAQEAAIAILDAKYSALAQLDSSKVGMMVAATKDMDPEIYNAALSIQQNCMDEENLKLYNLLTGYHTDGMAYYYRNYAAFVQQANLLTAALETLWGDAENQAALLDVMYEYADILNMTKEEIDKYIEPLGQLLEALRGMALIAPNAAIDVESDDLSALVDAIVAAQGKTQKYTSVSEDPALYISNIGKDAPDYISWNVEIYVDGVLMSLPANVPTSMTFRLDKSTNSYTLTSADAAAINDMFELAFDTVNTAVGNKLNINFYIPSFVGSMPEEAMVITETTTTALHYNAKEFTVSVEGTAEQIISLGTTLKVNLPASGSNTLRYDYIIDGKTVPAGSYTFTKQEIVRLFVDGKYSIDRVETKLNPVGDKLQGVVDNMNGGDVKVELDTTENEDGSYSYVMDMVIPTTVMNNPAGMTQMGMALFGGYTYIEMNNKVLLDGTKMYAQTLLDAVMNSGLNGKTIQNIANNNGGKLFSCELTMGASAEDANKVTTTLNIYLEGDSAELDQVAAALAYFENYVTITCTDGGLVMDLTLPEKAYQAYLAAMLMLDQRDLKNINDVDGKVALGYILDVMDPVMTDDTLTLDTFMNTLDKLGYGMDASMLEPYFESMVAVYNALVWNYDEDGIATTLTGRERVINLLKDKLGAMGGMVADEDIHVDITLNITNLQTDYEAAFVDISAEKLLDKVGMTTDLAGKSFAGKGAIVLLSDIGSVDAPVFLSFNELTIIDLNGYTIYGDVTANSGSVYICDSTLAVENEGGVTGKLTGNVRVTAGTYAQDITANLVDGYIKDANGNVKNSYYTINEDAAGNYIITLNAASVRRNNLPDFKAIALDMALDLALNCYDKGAMKIAGHKIYDIALENIVDSYATADKVDKLLDDIINGTAAQDSWFDIGELAELYDILVADLTDFDNIANGEYIAKYDIETAPWELSVFVDGDHLSAGVGALSGKFEKRTVTIVLSEDKVTEAVKDFAAELDNVLKVESDLDMSQNKTGNKIQLDINYTTSNIVIDLTGDDSYIVALGTLLADVVKNNTALFKGLETYEKYGTTNQLKYAIDNCTISDVLTALANVDSGYDFSKLGDLGDTYKDVLRAAGAVIRKLDIQDKGGRTIGSMESSEYAVYVLDKENFNRTKTKENIYRDYDVTVNVSVPLASVTIKLCNACQHANAEKITAKDATCTEDGNIEHWFCADCRTYFLDAECTRQVAKEDVIIPATGHDYKVEWNWAADYSWAIATFTCPNAGCTEPSGYAKDESIEIAVKEAASCDKEGTTTYTASVEFDGKTYTDVKEEPIEMLSHTYVGTPNSWEWTETATGYAVEAVFYCGVCSEEIKVAATVTSQTIGASCTVDGKTVYTASVKDSAGTEYTDTKEEPIIADGHDYVVSWKWEADFSGATATFTCADCDEINDVVTADVTTNGDGIYVATATYNGVLYMDIVTEEHDLVLDGWTWEADYSKATAHLRCEICGEKHDVGVISTSVTTDATCTEKGETVYTVELTVNGIRYTDTKTVEIPVKPHDLKHFDRNGASCTEDGNVEHWLCEVCGKFFADEACTQELTDVVIPATGHSYGAPEWAWAADNGSAVAKFTCSECSEVTFVEAESESITTGAGCESDGNIVYTVKVTFCGEEYTTSKTVILPATGHAYKLEGWTWAADYSGATVKLVCENKGCVKTVDAQFINVVTTAPNCTENGKNVYTAVVTVDGITYTDTKEQTLDAHGHDYELDGWTWSEDLKSAEASFTCDICGDKEQVKVDTTSKTDGATCTDDGKITYTASVTLDGNTYTDVKEQRIAATGHTYAVDSWNWAADHSSATVTVKCTCGDTQTATAIVTSKTTEPTFEADGSVVYTATAIYNGQTFTDSYTLPLKYKLSIDSVNIATDEKIVGVKFTDNDLIYLDIQPSGITVEQLLELLKVEYQADKLTLTVVNSKDGAGLVCNASKLVITASNKDGKSVTKTYTIIILGDVNGNGKIEVADTYLIAATRVGTSTVELSEYALLAADVNMNGGLDVADASRNANKIVFWDSYTTGL